MIRKLLDPSKLSEQVQRLVSTGAPAPMKMMAARAMAPLKPQETVLALYCLTFDPDQGIREAALETLGKLPEQVIDGALSRPMDPDVLDLLAEVQRENSAVLERIISNAATADETVESIAQSCDELTLEIIGVNQVRFLRFPKIIAALHQNPFTRMGLLDSVDELAKRNGIDVERLLGGGEVEPVPEEEAQESPTVQAPESPESPETHEPELEPVAEPETKAVPVIVLEEPAATNLTPPAVVVSAGDTMPAVEKPAYHYPPIYLEKGRDLTDAEKKALLKWMSEAPSEVQQYLAANGNEAVSMLLCKSKETSVAMALLKNKGIGIVAWGKIAGDRQANEVFIKAICGTKDLTRVYNIKAKLAFNPKTPISSAMGFVRGLRITDLKTAAKSKSIPVTLQNTAKGILKMHGIKLEEPKRN